MLLDTQRSHTFDYLLKSLGESVAWCVPRARADHAEGSLRSPSLAPWPFAKQPTDAVDSVRMTRRDLLGTISIAMTANLRGGRLVLYDPRRADPRSDAHDASDGFFDRMETPPWDGWVAFIGEPGRDGYLVAYVPPVLLDTADAGVERAGGLEWLDASAVGLWPWLRQRLV
ncbi:MAG: hypothetical protein H5U40_08090 [Polyangiaceae bacterium]|nr:hypothetical protein [Polyangiaceae bacterium]